MNTVSAISDFATPALVVLRPKLLRPQAKPDWLARPRLLAQLDQGLDRRLILVSAPAGFGKTTLLAQWLRTNPYPSAWLSLDEQDNRAETFLSYLTAALQGTFPEACPETTHMLRALQPPPLAYVTATLINEIEALSHHIILVLDDYHMIGNQALHTLMMELVEHAPGNLHLALVTRSDPMLPLAKYRARHQLLDLRAVDLRFTSDETQAFLAPILGAPISDENLAQLDRRTEGWIVGLRLAVLSLRGSRNPDEFIANFQEHGSRYVMEFLLTEVLEHQSPVIRSFLLRTSILTRLCGSLCDAVTGSSEPTGNGHALLRQIEQANLFLVALDEHGEWYACHPLFRELLQMELQTRYSQSEIVALHRQASAWFGERGIIDEALKHALAARDTEGAARLVEQQLHPILNQESWRTLEHWLTLLPEDLIQQRPALLLARAFVFHFQNRLAAISSLVRQAEALLERSGLALDEPDQRAVRSGIDTLRSQNLYFENDSAEGLAAAQRALENLPPSAVFARSLALSFLAMNHHHAGHGDVALRAAQQALDADAPPGAMTIRALIAICHIHRQDGRFDAAAHAARQLLALAQAQHRPLGVTWAHYVLGCVAYERNELDAAREHFLVVSEQRYYAHALTVHDSLVGLALTYQAHGWVVEAQETLQDLAEYALETNSPPALKAAQALEARLAVARGDLDTALALFESLESPPTPLLLLDPPPLIQVRILLAQASVASLRQAAERLQTLRQFAEATHSTWHHYAILALQAVVDDGLGNQKAALAALRQALLAAQPQHFVCTFVDTSPAMAHLLRELRSHGVATQYVDRLLSAFVSSPPRDSGAPAVPPATRIELAEPLTAREVEVLQLLDQRYSDKEIAQVLGVSSFTVHAHARNIYGKLGVNNRREAVAKAKAIGILAIR